jgi:acetoin utilization deacetylase AcuC-like enzyme
VTFVPGTYSSGTFEYLSSGVDALVIADVDSATDGQLYEAIVLVGGGATHTHSSDASGLFTFA